MRLAALMIAATTYQGKESATGHVDFSCYVEPVNRLSMERVGDVVIVDALAFGETYHRAHYEPGRFYFDTGAGMTAVALR